MWTPSAWGESDEEISGGIARGGGCVLPGGRRRRQLIPVVFGGKGEKGERGSWSSPTPFVHLSRAFVGGGGRAERQMLIDLNRHAHPHFKSGCHWQLACQWHTFLKNQSPSLTDPDLLGRSITPSDGSSSLRSPPPGWKPGLPSRGCVTRAPISASGYARGVCDPSLRSGLQPDKFIRGTMQPSTRYCATICHSERSEESAPADPCPKAEQ